MTDLIVVGAGAKAASVAAKVHALNTVGLGPLEVAIAEATEPAASWKGVIGMTSGTEPLAVTPLKDVGFPYESAGAFGDAGAAIDGAMVAFSWQRYIVARGGLGRWVDTGMPMIRHRDYGEYLAWVLGTATAGVRHVRGHVPELTLTEAGDRWAVRVSGPDGDRWLEAPALLLTGPGAHRHLPHDPAVASRMLHCDSDRAELAAIPLGEDAEVAIVGGGESALSAVMFLRANRPEVRLAVYTPTLPMSRGESFLENRVYSNPDSVAWDTLDLETRRAFIRHTDRGVFGPYGLGTIAAEDRCRFVLGRVTGVGETADGGRLRITYEVDGAAHAAACDFVFNATGFDVLEHLRGMLAPAARAAVERATGTALDAPPEGGVPIGRALELLGMQPMLHVPALSGLAQGPGFANLGCLGLVSDRVLAPLAARASGERPGALAATADRSP